mmetsp:Transcript_14411/g.47324  ORF Transcript_14411/g.47324 Transcript_14411/m.47324 type:complete len:302 (+) Transcript_14411:3036-3941(+)
MEAQRTASSSCESAFFAGAGAVSSRKASTADSLGPALSRLAERGKAGRAACASAARCESCSAAISSSARAIADFVSAKRRDAGRVALRTSPVSAGAAEANPRSAAASAIFRMPMMVASPARRSPGVSESAAFIIRACRRWALTRSGPPPAASRRLVASAAAASGALYASAVPTSAASSASTSTSVMRSRPRSMSASSCPPAFAASPLRFNSLSASVSDSLAVKRPSRVLRIYLMNALSEASQNRKSPPFPCASRANRIAPTASSARKANSPSQCKAHASFSSSSKERACLSASVRSCEARW